MSCVCGGQNMSSLPADALRAHLVFIDKVVAHVFDVAVEGFSLRRAWRAMSGCKRTGAVSRRGYPQHRRIKRFRDQLGALAIVLGCAGLRFNSNEPAHSSLFCKAPYLVAVLAVWLGYRAVVARARRVNTVGARANLGLQVTFDCASLSQHISNYILPS